MSPDEVQALLLRVEELEAFRRRCGPAVQVEAILSNIAWVHLAEQQPDAVTYITDVCAGMIATAEGVTLENLPVGIDRDAFRSEMISMMNERCHSLIDFVEQAVAKR